MEKKKRLSSLKQYPVLMAFSLIFYRPLRAGYGSARPRIQ